MKATNVCTVVLVTCLLACLPAAAQDASIAELEKQLAADPTSFKTKVALAEAYLHGCELDKSLKLWREVLKAAPEHERAKYVVGKLTGQLLDLDSRLEMLEKLIEKGVTGGVYSLLEDASRRAATDVQKARVLYLKGRLAVSSGRAEPAAAGHFQAAMKLYPTSPWAGRAAIAIAELELRRCAADEAKRLLRAVAAGKEISDEAVREEARYHLVRIAAADLTPLEGVSSLRRLLQEIKTPRVKRMILWRIGSLAMDARGEGLKASVEATAAVLAAEPPFDEALKALQKLLAAAQRSQDRAALDAIIAELERNRPGDAALAREASFVVAEALLSRAAVEDDAAKMRGLVARAGELLAKLEGEAGVFQDRKRLSDVRGRALLVEAQKLIALDGPAAGLPLLMKAREHYLARLPADPAPSLGRLRRIASLLEHVGQWETAVGLYRQIASRFGHLPAGRDALWRLAWVYNYKLDAPMAALEACAEYASRYPAELPYRQLSVGRRLRRLGYVNVLGFQKRNGLQPDGMVGPRTRRKLEELEESFDMIAARDEAGGQILRGRFVHPTIFSIARRLDKAGRHHDAIAAYRMFLNLFPGKKDADEALIAVARIFRDNLLFEEALGAYRELMADFPKGSVTSEAYIEAAGCLENLGRWKEAGELYELYVKKFPKYKHVALCKSRRALLEEIVQYEDFIASNPQSPKLAEARYQIAVILYKKLMNLTKAAIQFAEVARLHPKHVRASDGLYTAGAAHLHAENFPAARKAFAALASGYGDSRLADDAQYWIGHTYEYSARALGRLGARRIVLKRRSLAARVKLLDDMRLRRRYYRAAEPGPELPEEVWGTPDPLGLGVLTSGSKRDRVNADLSRAIAAYREVAEKFKMGDMAGPALLRIGAIYTKYLKDPEKGVEAYRQLLAHYPGSTEAVDALYEVGVYQIKKKDYDAAVASFRQFVYNYPREPKVEDAMLAIAQCHASKKDWKNALDAYQRYLNKFPQGRHVEFARARIEWIRMYHY